MLQPWQYPETRQCAGRSSVNIAALRRQPGRQFPGPCLGAPRPDPEQQPHLRHLR